MKDYQWYQQQLKNHNRNILIGRIKRILFLFAVFIASALLPYAIFAAVKSRDLTTYENLGYHIASKISRQDIIDRGKYLSEVACRESGFEGNTWREELELAFNDRVNYNTYARCVDVEYLYKKNIPISYRLGDDKFLDVAIKDHKVAMNEVRAKEGRPLFYIIEDATNIRFVNTPDFSVGEFRNRRGGACAFVYRLGMIGRKPFGYDGSKDGFFCNMKVIDATEPKMQYRRNYRGSFYEYDYSSFLLGFGRILPELDEEGSFNLMISDKNPSRFPFVWRSTMTVILKTGVKAELEWDYTDENYDASWIPRWSVSSVNPDRTKWIGDYTFCSHDGKLCRYIKGEKDR